MTDSQVAVLGSVAVALLTSITSVSIAIITHRNVKDIKSDVADVKNDTGIMRSASMNSSTPTSFEPASQPRPDDRPIINRRS